MGYQPRVFEKFENAAGTISYALPPQEYEFEQSQGLYVPSAPLPGANYSYDQLGAGLAPKQDGHVRLRFVELQATPDALDTKIDELMTEVRRAGRGKLYSIDRFDVRRWAYARAMAMPELRWKAGEIFQKSSGIHWAINSDFYGITPITADVTLNANPTVFSINNTGTAQVFNAIFIFKGTFVNPRLSNGANGYAFESFRDGSNANHWLRIDCGGFKAEFSTNAGGTYTGDLANMNRQAGRVQWMVVDPGNQSMTASFGGVPNGILTYFLYPAFD